MTKLFFDPTESQTFHVYPVTDLREVTDTLPSTLKAALELGEKPTSSVPQVLYLKTKDELVRFLDYIVGPVFAYVETLKHGTYIGLTDFSTVTHQPVPSSEKFIKSVAELNERIALNAATSYNDPILAITYYVTTANYTAAYRYDIRAILAAEFVDWYNRFSLEAYNNDSGNEGNRHQVDRDV